MKLLYDFFPILLFFVAFKFFGIYVATGVAIAATVLQVLFYRVVHKRFEAMHIVTLTMIVLFGGLTLIFHNPIFIKWKPTMVFWIFGLGFLGSHFFKKPLIKSMMGNKLELPKKVWSKLNISWGLFFLIIGSINLYIAYHFSTNTWVNFKLYGLIGLLLLFAVIQAWYLASYIDVAEEQ